MKQSIKIPLFQRWALGLAWGGLVLSGVAWLLLRLGMGADPDPAGAAWQWKSASMAVHGGVAFLFLLVLGSLWPHLRAAASQLRNRLSGWTTLRMMAAILGSAWMLYYGPAERREWVSLAHWTLGLLLTALLPIHAWLGRRSRPKKRR
jgi:hypothetical protein